MNPKSASRPSTNPYASSTAAATPGEMHANAKKRVSRPATALLIMASINSVFPAITLVSACFDFANGKLVYEAVGVLILNSIQLLFLILISIGAAKMGHLESYRLGRFAAVCACIPCLSPFIVAGIPFGIWALCLLADPSIRSAYPDSPALTLADTD